MALTITENFRMTAGGRQFRYLTVTHDESTSTFTAVSAQLTYLDHVEKSDSYIASDPPNTSVLLHHMLCTMNATHDVVDLGYPLPVGSKTRVMLIGW